MNTRTNIPFRIVATAMVALSLSMRPAVIAADRPDDDPPEVLTETQWRQLDDAVDRALHWIASQQQPDGSFRGPDIGQPAITSFCVLALVSRGHLPGQGQYGKHLDRAIHYMLSCQRDDGLFSRVKHFRPVHEPQTASHAAVYNHAITGLTLSELHGMTGRDSNERVSAAITRALVLTHQLQDRPKHRRPDEGGWRYLYPRTDFDSDLSITSWQLMFYRSAKNAGFDVPSERIDRAMRFVLACWDAKASVFRYAPPAYGDRTRSMTGAGVLALAHSGMFDHQISRQAGDWLLANPYTRYRHGPDDGHFFYGVFYTLPAMYMLGGQYWQQFFPQTVQLLLRHQNDDGSWEDEPGVDSRYGNTFTTAMVVTALNTPNQLLPIMQR